MTPVLYITLKYAHLFCVSYSLHFVFFSSFLPLLVSSIFCSVVWKKNGDKRNEDAHISRRLPMTHHCTFDFSPVQLIMCMVIQKLNFSRAETLGD
jgi:hypothetical protein